MIVVGIVAEYDPLHTGHSYHISKSRNCASADAVIAVISSNFVQRGRPAAFDKHLRARAAVLCGVDLAIELPVVFSSSSAGSYADAAVDLLAATGVVGAISFGAETVDGSIERAAAILADESEDFKLALRRGLELGRSFADSRADALETIMPGGAALLRSPNNALGVSYVRRIVERDYAITPRAVERVGSSHASTAPQGIHASASAIRSLISDGDVERAARFLPDGSRDLFVDAIVRGRSALDDDAAWRIYKSAIVRGGIDAARESAMMNEGLENRMVRAAWAASSFEDLLEKCSTRRYPRTRVARHATASLLGITREDAASFASRGPAYIRPLAMNSRGRELLREISRVGSLPVVSRPSAYDTPYSARMMSFEHVATELRELMTASPTPRAEARSRPQIV